MFLLSKEELQKNDAEVTVREIEQQPELWQEVLAYFQEESTRIQSFFKKIREEHNHIRVIFTGAGSSAYVGDTILPYLKEIDDESLFEFQAIPTTTLVSNPKSYFKKDKPTILVSFARSGNSPESIASVELGQQIVDDFYQITITCAPQGKLALKAADDSDNLLLLMPDRSNDQGFAMTGSFTCMTLMATLLFDSTELDIKERYVNQIIEMAQHIFHHENEIEDLIKSDFNRVIYLASGPLAGIAREVQLKILELTAGKMATAFDSSLGFRHGPKSFIDNKSLAFLLVSNDPYTRQYDLDMLEELHTDGIANCVFSVEVAHENSFSGAKFSFDARYQDLPDAYLALPYTVFGQVISMLSAIKVGNKPDNPSPTGTVNRVVKGVIIHKNLNQ